MPSVVKVQKTHISWGPEVRTYDNKQKGRVIKKIPYRGGKEGELLLGKDYFQSPADHDYAVREREGEKGKKCTRGKKDAKCPYNEYPCFIEKDEDKEEACLSRDGTTKVLPTSKGAEVSKWGPGGKGGLEYPPQTGYLADPRKTSLAPNTQIREGRIKVQRKDWDP